MTREERSVILAILTLIVYAGFLFYDTGAILFPFPLNELIFLIVTIQFSIWNWNNNRTLLVLLLAASILNFISTQFFWTFFLKNDQMEQLVSGISLDLLKISYYLFLIIGVSYYFLTTKITAKYLFLVISIPPIIFTMFTSISIPETVSFIFIAFFGFKNKMNHPFPLLWLLLAMLQLMKICTLYV